MADVSDILKDPKFLECFWAKVEKRGPDECWLWLGGKSTRTYTSGKAMAYGQIHIGGVHQRAHRVSVLLSGRELPPGMEVDHLCRTTLCVNPAHLEVVTHRENVLRGTAPMAALAAQTHCMRGHLMSEHARIRENGWRACRACEREVYSVRNSERRAAKKQALAENATLREQLAAAEKRLSEAESVVDFVLPGLQVLQSMCRKKVFLMIGTKKAAAMVEAAEAFLTKEPTNANG